MDPSIFVPKLIRRPLFKVEKFCYLRWYESVSLAQHDTESFICSLVYLVFFLNSNPRYSNLCSCFHFPPNIFTSLHYAFRGKFTNFSFPTKTPKKQKPPALLLQCQSRSLFFGALCPDPTLTQSSPAGSVHACCSSLLGIAKLKVKFTYILISLFVCLLLLNQAGLSKSCDKVDRLKVDR